MPTAEYDVGYLRTAAGLLEKYLLSKDIYWKISARSPAGEPAYPSLTIGGMLLALRRLRARQLEPELNQAATHLRDDIDSTRSRWRAAWGEKAIGEFRMRLNLWRDYLEDFRSNPEANVSIYSYSIGRRVMLQLLMDDVSEIPQAEKHFLEGLDGILAAILVPGDYIWEEDLSPGFPRNEFPYLYGTLKH